MPATKVTVVDPGDGRKAIRHLDHDCPELVGVEPRMSLGQMAATATVRALTVRCHHCFAETERREAAAQDRGTRRTSTRRIDLPPPTAHAVSAPSASVSVASHLVRVARCPNLAACLDDEAPDHPCATIVLNQWQGVPPSERLARWREAHQLPEPWDGHLENAPILFVSSNPSISGSVHGRRPAASRTVRRLAQPASGSKCAPALGSSSPDARCDPESITR